jgi:hypothetical protein
MLATNGVFPSKTYNGHTTSDSIVFVVHHHFECVRRRVQAGRVWIPTSVVEFSLKRTFGPGFDSLKKIGSSWGAA